MCVVGAFFCCVEMKNNGIFASSVRVAYNSKNKIQYFVYIHAMVTDSYKFVLYMYRVCVNPTEFLTVGFRSITPERTE